MSRDSNGNATVNRQQAVTGQTVLAEQVNVPFDDIQAMLNLVFWRDGLAPMTGPINMNGFSITGLQDPSNGGDPVTLSYLNNTITQSGVPTGAVEGFRSKVAPAGWIKEDGRTIGNIGSGATSLASAAAMNLFVHLWTQFNNTELPIQDSAGAASTRGASALADFNANKRMPLFDSRSRFRRAADDGLNFDASLIVGVRQDDAIKTHVHTGTTSVAGGHVHPATISSGSGGNRITGGASTPIGTDTQSIGAAGDHAHPFTTDATGIALETRPRSIVELVCIKL